LDVQSICRTALIVKPFSGLFIRENIDIPE
jgi:hypothetical protein